MKSERGKEMTSSSQDKPSELSHHKSWKKIESTMDRVFEKSDLHSQFFLLPNAGPEKSECENKNAGREMLIDTLFLFFFSQQFKFMSSWMSGHGLLSTLMC